MKSKVEAREAAASEKLDPALVRMVWIFLAGVLAPLFDTTIMNVAIGTLGQAFDASVSTIQWVMTGYLLALGIVIPVNGWAMERFGGKRMWVFALLLFLAGSVLSSVSWNIGSLIGFRAVQGVGGGLMLPIMQTMIVRRAGGQKLGKLMAVAGLPALVGPILGPVVGGLIVDHLSWRWIFLVNIPICLFALIWAWLGLPKDADAKIVRRLDVTGLALLSPSVVLIIYGLAQVESESGFLHAGVLVPLALGVVLLASFAVYALKKADASLMDLRLFKVRSFTASSVIMFLSGLTTYGAMLLLPLYYQQVRGESVLAAGLLLAPQGVGMLLTRSWAGKLTDRIGARPVVLAGTLLTALGTLPFVWAGIHTSELLLGAALVVRGAGLGAVFLPVMAASYHGLGKEQIPHASTATRIIQQIGGAFGASVLAILLQNQLAGHSAGVLGQAAAFDRTFLWSLCFTAGGLIPAALLPRVAKRG